MLSFITPQDLAIALVAFFPLAVLLLAVVLVYVVRKLPKQTIANDVKAVETDVANAVQTVRTDITARVGLLQRITDKLRMVVWLAFGIAAYLLSLLAGPANPVIQTTFYKIGHVTTLAWIGYWIARNAIGRIGASSTPNDRIARALVIGAVIVAGSLGL